MLAMTYRGPYRVRVVEKPMPEIEHPRDAIVRVTRACICGSDLHLYHGLVPDTRIGQTLGHEFVGVVEEVGANVKNLKPGDRVIVPFNIFCGECYFCRKGFFANCHNVNPNATRDVYELKDTLVARNSVRCSTTCAQSAYPVSP